MKPILFTLILAFFVLSLFAPALFAAPTPEEILAMHQAAFDSIRSGRITYTEKRNLGPEQEKGFRDSMLQHADDSNRADLEEQARADWVAMSADAETRLVFDVDADSYLSKRSFVKSPDELMAEHNVSDTFVKSFSGDNWNLIKGDEQRTLSTGHNFYSISEHSSSLPSPLIQHFSHGLLVGPMASSLQLSEPVPDETNENLYHATLLPDISGVEKQMGRPLTEEEMQMFSQVRIEVTLDSSVGYRAVEMRTFRGGTLAMTMRTEFTSFDDCILPQHTVMSRVDADGNESVMHETTLLSAEINVPIDPSEFTLAVPPGATVSDSRTGVFTNPEIEKARADSLVPDTSPTEKPPAEPLARIPAEDSPTAELYPPGRAAPDTPTRPYSPSAPAADRSHTLLIVLLLAGAVLAAVALILIRKGKRS